MKEVSLHFWNERDMANAVVALSKSYKLRTILNATYADVLQPFTIIVEVPDHDIKEAKK